MAQAARNIPYGPESEEISGVGGRAANDNTFDFLAANDNQNQSPSEARVVAELGRNRGVARRQSAQTAKDPNEADRLEIEGIKARVEQLDGDGNPSLSATQDSNGDIIANLKFDVPLSAASSERLAARRLKQQNTPSPARSYSPVSRPRPSSSSLPKATDPVSEEEPTVDDFTLDEPGLLSDDEKPFSDESTTKENRDNSPSPDEQSSEEESEKAPEEENPFDTEVEEEEKEREKKSAEQQAYEQQIKIKDKVLEDEKKEKDELMREQTQKQAQQQAQAQARQAQNTAQNPLTRELMKATQKKQQLDRKLSRLKAEKIALQAALYAAKALKAIVDIIQSATKWIASGCMTLAWTIILGIIGIILYIVYGLLFIPKTALWSSIKLIQAKINSLNKDIEKTKKTQQEAVSVIKSIRRKMSGREKQSKQKFDVPQDAATAPSDT